MSIDPEFKKEFSSVSENIIILTKLFDLIYKDIQDLKSFVKDKVSKEEFISLQKKVFKIETDLAQHVKLVKEKNDNFSSIDEKTKTKLTELEFSLWKLGFITTTSGIIGGGLSKLLELLFN